MKTLLLATALFITTLSFQKGPSVEVDQKLTATFTESTEDGEYKFKDNKGQIHVFQELGDDVDYDLLDDENIGKTFSIVWEVGETEDYDEEGELTGKMIKVNRITSISITK